MTTGSKILSDSLQQIKPEPELTGTVASSLSHSTGTTAAKRLISMGGDDSAGTGILSQQQDIPRSVKGAPAHLRQAIRKRQNSESARRSRKRRKEAACRFYQRFDQQCQRMIALETRIAQLIDVLRQRQKMGAGSDSFVEEQQDTNWVSMMEQTVQVAHPPEPCGNGAIGFEEELEALWGVLRAV